jgi:glycosyltransferase
VNPPSLAPVVESLPKRGLTEPTDDWGRSTPTVPMRFCSYAGGAELPRWVLERGSRPRVLTTAGVVPDAFFGEGGLMREIILGTQDLGIELVVTIAEAERSTLPSPLPGHVTLVDWVPLRALLATSDGIVHHGGQSTTYSSFAAAVPQLVIPSMADGAISSHLIVGSRAGAALELSDTSAATVASAVSDLLQNASYREAGQELAVEMGAMPEPGTVIGQVTEAVGRVPAQA